MRDYTRSRVRLTVLVLVAVVAMALAACSSKSSKATQPGSTGTAASNTATASSGVTWNGKCGPAGIASDPRSVAGLFTINDCIALSKTRPAGDDRTGVTKDTIVIGRSSPHTGGMAQWLPTAQTMQKVVDAVNQAGGVFGRKIKLIDLDNAGTPARGTDVAKQLVEQDKVFATFGNLCVACELATYKYYASKGVPDIFLFANGPWVAEPTITTMFGGGQAALEDGLALGTYVGKQKPGGKVSVVYQDDAYGQPLLAGFKVGLAQASSSATIAKTITYNIANASDLSSQAQEAASTHPDYVAFLGTAIVPFIKALRETAGYTGPVVIAQSSASSSNAVAAGTQNFNNVTADLGIYTTHQLDEAAVAAAKTWAQQNGLAFNTYVLDGIAWTQMLVHSLELAGPDLTRQGLVDAMQTGFSVQSSWKCSLCVGPIVFGAQDHWAIETVQMVHWDSSAKGFVPVPGMTPIDMETSKGHGIRGNIPGYPCAADTCPWKGQ